PPQDIFPQDVPVSPEDHHKTAVSVKNRNKRQPRMCLPESRSEKQEAQSFRQTDIRFRLPEESLPSTAEYGKYDLLYIFPVSYKHIPLLPSCLDHIRKAQPFQSLSQTVDIDCQ